MHHIMPHSYASRTGQGAGYEQGGSSLWLCARMLSNIETARSLEVCAVEESCGSIVPELIVLSDSWGSPMSVLVGLVRSALLECGVRVIKLPQFARA